MMTRSLTLRSLAPCLLSLALVSCGGTALHQAESHRPIASACAKHPAGAVDAGPGGGGADQCTVDQDCGATGVCSCAGMTFGWAKQSPFNVCVPSNCRVDADCGAGGACSPTVSFDLGSFYGVQGYYCHTPADLCGSDADCTAQPMGQCAYQTTLGHWACSYNHAAG